jgi:hypothetical protein
MRATGPWCLIRILRPDDAELLRIVLDGPAAPGLAAVDRIARMALGARRDGLRLVLAEVSPELADLLELAGLGVEVQREPEAREQPLGIEGREEEAHRDNPLP